MVSTWLSATSVLSKGSKVDHQPAGDGRNKGTVATKKVTDKVKAGRLQRQRWTEIDMWHSAR
jgi:hypothetical protein